MKTILSGLVPFGFAILLLFRLKSGIPLYLFWLTLMGASGAYQWRFALTRPSDRPEKYDVTNLVLHAGEVIIGAAVALYCGVGWIGAILLLTIYLSLGRLVGSMVRWRVLRDVHGIIGKTQPNMAHDEKNRLAQAMFDQRLSAYKEGR